MRIALATGLALIATAIALTLARAPLVVAGTNSIPYETVVATTLGPARSCQGGEVVPAGTTAVRLWLQDNIQPRVRVALLAGTRTLASGVREGGWLGKVTTVPIARVPRTLRGVRLCLWVDRAVQAASQLGAPTRHPAPGEPAGKMRVEYLRPGASSWWSLLEPVTRRLGIGRAPEGAWAFLIPLAAIALAALLACWGILRWIGGGQRRVRPAPRQPAARQPAAQQAAAQQAAPRQPAAQQPAARQPEPRRRRPWAELRRVPGPAWACACVAFLSAASWSIVTPPFQAPDEPSHFAYTQVLAETGALPSSNSSAYSPEELTVLADLDHQEVRFNPAIQTIGTAAQQQRLRHDLALGLSRSSPAAGVAASEPPLYYALETIPYYLGSGSTLLTRLELMRLGSALFAALAAFFAFLFLREVLPAVPWAWTVGGLGTALAPLLGFMSGVVNPDAMLCAVAAALFFCVARGFRRGLTARLAIAIGALTAIGFMTKLNFLGLAPGVLLALVLLAHRAAPRAGRAAYRWLAAAVALALAPGALYVLVNLLSNHAAFGAVSQNISSTGTQHESLLRELSYIWQFYLPRLPGMTNYFPGLTTIRQLWFDKLVGQYGWLDTVFPSWVYTFALLPAALVAGLCLRELIRVRVALRSRAGELIAYAAMALGLLALFGANSYLEVPVLAGSYSEARYLLPLVVLFAAIFALAARGAGRRWGPAVGALLVLLILAHDIFAQLQVVARFYG